MVNAVKPSETPEPKKPKLPASLPHSALKLRESCNNEWRAVIPRGVEPERVLDSDFWAAVSRDFLPYDTIKCIGEARDFYTELLVLEAGSGYCALVKLNHIQLPALLVSQKGLPPNHEIYYSGPEKLYCVKRNSDSVVMGEGFTSREAALEYLLDHASLR